MYGTSLQSVWAAHQARVERNRTSSIPEVRHPGSITELSLRVSGQYYPVFAPGVDDPDDASTERWVP